MSRRARFVAYLVVVHVLMAVAAWLVAGIPVRSAGDHEPRGWLLLAELVIAVSFLAGLHLVRSFSSSIEFVRDSAQLLEDSDLMSRVREVGQPEIDRLIRVYNRMVDSLRSERVRLQEQHHFLTRVLDESPGGIIVLDLEGRLSLINPAAARLLRARPDDVLSRPLGALDHPLAQELSRLPEGESRVLSIWGGRRVRAVHGTFPDRGFRRSFFLLEELTEELRQSEKAAYERLIRMLSHEVNNTVGAGNSLLHSCLEYGRQLPPEDRHDFEHALRVVIARTEQLTAFMKSFADVVRLPPPRRQPTDLGELLHGVAALLRPQLAERGVTLKWEGNGALGAIALDRVQMEQALLNVLKNACEAAGRGGTITIRQRRQNELAVLEIQDSGPGIPPEVRGQLFTPFFSTKEHGQGIGLTLVQEVLSNHGLTFSLDSEPGGPTTFTILFGD